MADQTDAALRAAFDAMTAQARLTIAPDRREVMFDAFKSVRELMSELDRPFAVLGEVDLLATAAISGPAPKLLDVETGPWRTAPPITVPFNVTGHPALSLCCGYSSDGLPLALQLAGRAFDEAMLFRVGDAYGRATTWRQRRPVVAQSAAVAAE